MMAQPTTQLLVQQDVIDDYLDRPRLENVRQRFGEHRNRGDGHRLPMWPDEVVQP